METTLETPKTGGTQSCPLNAEQCELVLTVGRMRVRQKGVYGEDNEDLANDFLLRFLEQLKQHPETDLSIAISRPALFRAADGWIQHALRTHWRTQNREVPWPSTVNEPGASECMALLSNAPSPETQAIRGELHQRIQQGITEAHLSPALRELLSSLLKGERAIDIAHRLHCKPEAIRQRSRTLRVRLRAAFLNVGFAEAEVDEYLHQLN
jgi:DNA-directed RNA polymerase specialized sigma24 family protein